MRSYNARIPSNIWSTASLDSWQVLTYSCLLCEWVAVVLRRPISASISVFVIRRSPAIPLWSVWWLCRHFYLLYGIKFLRIEHNAIEISKNSRRWDTLLSFWLSIQTYILIERTWDLFSSSCPLWFKISIDVIEQKFALINDIQIKLGGLPFE